MAGGPQSGGSATTRKPAARGRGGAGRRGASASAAILMDSDESDGGGRGSRSKKAAAKKKKPPAKKVAAKKPAARPSRRAAKKSYVESSDDEEEAEGSDSDAWAENVVTIDDSDSAGSDFAPEPPKKTARGKKRSAPANDKPSAAKASRTTGRGRTKVSRRSDSDDDVEDFEEVGNSQASSVANWGRAAGRRARSRK